MKLEILKKGTKAKKRMWTVKLNYFYHLKDGKNALETYIDSETFTQVCHWSLERIWTSSEGWDVLTTMLSLWQLHMPQQSQSTVHKTCTMLQSPENSIWRHSGRLGLWAKDPSDAPGFTYIKLLGLQAWPCLLRTRLRVKNKTDKPTAERGHWLPGPSGHNAT